MKKLLAALAVVIGVASISRAGDITFSKYVVNQVVTSTINYDIDLSTNGIEDASVQVSYSSASPSTVNFGDGTPSTCTVTFSEGANGISTAPAFGTITISSAAGLIPTAAHATITISSNGATGILTGSSITINGVGLLAGTDYTVTASSVGTAASISQAINANGLLNKAFTAAFSVNQITITAISSGTYGNAYTLSTSTSALIVNGSSVTGRFIGGVDNPTLTFNGYPLVQGAQWTAAAVASNTAISLCDALNNGFGSIITATTTASNKAVIIATAVTAGTAGNAYGFVSSTIAAMSSSTTFKGGVDNAVFTINGYPMQVNTQFFGSFYSSGTVSSSGTAANFNTALGVKPFAQMVTSAIQAANKAIVTATSTIVGYAANYAIATSTPAAMAVSSSSMVNGTDSDVTWNSQISISSNPTGPLAPGGGYFPGAVARRVDSIYKVPTSWGVGLPVVFASVTGSTIPQPLTNLATYYATNLTASSFQLARTSTDAIAGNAIQFSTIPLKGGDTYSIIPSTISGTFTFKFQKSNDGVNFSDIYVTTGAITTPFISSLSIPTPYTASTVVWDLGKVYQRYLRFSFTNAAWGGLNVGYFLQGRKD